MRSCDCTRSKLPASQAFFAALANDLSLANTPVRTSNLAGVTDADIEAVIADEIYQPPETWHLNHIQVSCGDHSIPTATVSLTGSDGKTYDLASYKGKQAVVIAWFPKAFTGG